jgi:hypothetical protein
VFEGGEGKAGVVKGEYQDVRLLDYTPRKVVCKDAWRFMKITI